MRGTKKLFMVMLMIGVLASAPWALTQAVWSDSAAVDANTFTTGTLDISTSPSTALLTFSAMTPGDTVTASLTVSNAGTMAMRYAMSTSISGSTTLANGLTLAIKSSVTTCTNAGFSATGTSVYSGTVTSGAIGDATQGSHTGDRSLSASASEALCFQVALPSNAANSLQGLTATATFTFSAEQTANNP